MMQINPNMFNGDSFAKADIGLDNSNLSSETLETTNANPNNPVDAINDGVVFLQQIMGHSKANLSVTSMLQAQDKLEQVGLNSTLISKAIGSLSKDIDSLVKMQ